MWQFSATLLAISTTILLADSPGATIRLGQNGLNYVKQIGLQVMNAEIGGIKIPDVHGKKAFQPDRVGGLKSWYSYDLTDIQIKKFDAPNELSTIAVNTDRNLVWSANGISLSVAAHYHVSFIGISHSGDVSASATSVGFSVDADIRDVNSRPSIVSKGSQAHIGSIDLHFSGDLIDDILNLISGPIGDYLKGALADVLASEANSLINTQANNLLQGIPISIDIYDDISVDYSLTSDPTFGNDFVQLNLRGEFFAASNHYSGAAANLPDFPTGNAMAYVQLSDYSVNSVAFALQSSGANLLSLTVDSATLKPLGAEGILRTSCPIDPPCLGSLIPQIGQTFPNSTVTILLQSTKAPVASVVANMITASAYGQLDFQVAVADGTKQSAFIANVDLSEQITNLRVEDYKIKGTIQTVAADLTLLSSNIGDINSASLQQIWQLAVVTLMDSYLNSLVGSGIAIPDIPYIKLINPAVAVEPGNLRVSADITYTGPTLQ